MKTCAFKKEKVGFAHGYRFGKLLRAPLCVFLCICTGSFLNSCATAPKQTYLNNRSLSEISKVAIVASITDPKVYNAVRSNVSGTVLGFTGIVPALFFAVLVAALTERAIRSGVDNGHAGEVKEHTSLNQLEEKVAQSFIQTVKEGGCFRVAEYLADKNQNAQQLSAKGYNAVIRLVVYEVSLERVAGDNVRLHVFVRGQLENLPSGKIPWDREERVWSPENHPLDYYRENGLKELDAMLEKAGRNFAYDFVYPK
jgi:hypothetical protein